MAIQASIPPLHNGDGIHTSGGLQWMMEGDGGMLQNDSFQFQQQQQHQHQQQQQMWVASASPPSLLPTSATALAAAGSLDRASMASSYQPLLQNILEKQRKEIDLYVRQESSRFMALMHQQQKQRLSAILVSLEVKASSLLRQKDSELESAKQRTMELELCLRLIEEEKETWERIAKENDAMAISLNNTLERVREPRFSSSANGAAEQEASCSGFAGAAQASASGWRPCRACGRAEARAVLLPCRHLCCCLTCAASASACPLCASPKRNSVEVFLE